MRMRQTILTGRNYAQQTTDTRGQGTGDTTKRGTPTIPGTSNKFKNSNHKRAQVERRCPDACGGEVGVRASVGEVGERAGWAGSGALGAREMCRGKWSRDSPAAWSVSEHALAMSVGVRAVVMARRLRRVVGGASCSPGTTTLC